MNKIYKLVWSKVRNAWVVASEIAKGHGKNASVTRERKLLKTAVITAIMGGCLMTGGLASAALTAEQQAVYDAVMAKLEERGGNHYVSITTSKDEKQGNYDNKGATGSDSIAIGGKAVTPSNGSIALGSGAVAGDVNKLPKDNTGRMISIGNESHANNQNTIALGNYSKAYGFMGIAIGTEALTTNDKRPGYNYTDGIAVGNYSISDGTSALAIGERSIAQASNAVSIGKRAYASEDSFAGGNAAIAQSNSIALGHGAVVYQEKKYWDDNKAGKDQMINATKGADAEYIYGGGDNKGWFAYKKMTTPNFSAIAVGAYSQVTDVRGTAIGYAANAASKDALAMGTHATVTKEAERGVALGTFSVASRKGDVLGYNPVSGKAFENEAEVAAYLGKADEYKTLEEKIKTQQEDYKAKQAAYEADKGNADKRKAANEAKTELSKSVSEKYTMLGAFLSRPGAVSVGDSDFTRQITNVAAGSEDTDAVNVAQLKALDNKVDKGAIHYFSVKSDDSAAPAGTNWNNDGATGKDAIAIGKKAVSEGDGSIAIGRGAKVFNTNQDLGMAIGAEAESSFGSIVIGKKARDYDTDPKKGAFGVYIGREAKSLGGSSQTVIGNYGQAKGEDSTAIGTRAQALGGESLAVGSSAKSLGQGAASFGTDSIAEFDESTALGTYSNGRGNKSVASGNKSVAAGHNSVAIGYQTFAHNGFIDEDAYKALSPEEQKKYFEASGINAYFLKDTADGNDAKKIGDTYLNTAVGSYSKAYKHATTLGGMTSAKEEGTAVGTYAKAYKKGAASLGYRAQSNAENGVALGAYSFADREKGKIGYVLGGDNSTLEKALESIGQKAKYDELTGKIAPFKDEYNGLLKAYQDAPAKSAEETTAKQKLDDWKAAHPDFLPAVKEKQQMIAAWQSGNGAVSVGSAGATRQITNVAAGSEDTDAVNVAQLKALDNKVTDQLKDAGGVHYFSVNSDDKNAPDGTNWNNDGASGKDAVAIGKKAAASGESAFATGWKSKAAGYSDIAIGREAEATGGWGVAIGQEAKAQASTAVAMAFAAEAKGANSLAIGVQSEARTNDSSAYGRGAKALGQVALAVGTLTQAEGNHSSVFGYKATTDSTAWNGTAIGRGAYIGKQMPNGTKPDIGVSDNYYTPVDDDTVVEAGKETKNSTAVGFGAKSFGYQNTAVGAGAEAFDTNTVAVGVLSKAIGNYANALGKQARAEGKDSIAIGHFARAIGESSTVLGDYAITSTLDGKKGVSKSVAVGSHARAASDNSIALGNNSLANIADDVKTEAYLSKEAFKKENGVVSVGNKEYTVGNEKIEQNYRRITNVAGGADDHDAVNVAQLKALTAAPMMNFYFGGKNENNVYTPGGTNWSMSLNEFRMDFGDGLKAEQVEKDGKTYTLVTLDKDSLKNDPAFKGDKGDAGAAGKDGKSAYDTWKEQPGNNGKTEKEFLDGLKGEKGENGKDGAAGKDGKSAYDIWKEKPGNENKTEEDFRKDLKGEKGENGKDGAAGKDGKSAYDIWKEKPGNENKTEEDFRKDLKGEKGENGKDGAAGKDGKSAYDIWKEKPGNENKTEKDFLDSLKGKDGKDGVGGAAVEAGANISVDKTDPAKAIVSLKKDITVDSVNAGGVTIDKAGINAGGKKVTGVAPGDISKDSTDAVNGSQLFAMNQKVESNMNQINNLRDESREGDAMGAAMAALKPIDFDPYQRSQVMAGVGYYRGKEAVALGLAHYKNEDLMFHGGLAYAGNSELMANIGVTYRFGSKDDRDIKHERNLRMPQYAEGPISSVYMLQDEVERLTKENKEANDRIAALEAKLEQVLEKVK